MMTGKYNITGGVGDGCHELFASGSDDLVMQVQYNHMFTGSAVEKQAIQSHNDRQYNITAGVGNGYHEVLASGQIPVMQVPYSAAVQWKLKGSTITIIK
jgi:hypothetical protein